MKKDTEGKNLGGSDNTGSTEKNSSDRSGTLKKPVFYASSLKVTPPRTAEDIRRAMAEGRFAEMTPHQAGIDAEK
jgi:hypothetical protein